MRRPLETIWYSVGVAVCSLAVAPRAVAQVFDGSGLKGGVDVASQIDGPSKAPLRSIIVLMLNFILDFLALAATIMIIAAGFFLVTSLGNEDAKTKAKNIIKYVLIGLVVILFARFIVSYITKALPPLLGA